MRIYEDCDWYSIATNWFLGEKHSSSETIRNYKLGKTLGQGTFGKVKIAVHISTGEKVTSALTQVAVKVLEKSRMTEEGDLERVTREIHILRQIRHPNIIQLYDVL